MADIDLSTIFAALTAADKQAQADNPFNPLSSFGDQLGDLSIKASVGKKPADAAIAGLISGLVSGGASNLGRGYVQKQDDLAYQLMADNLGGGPSVFKKPDAMSPSVFNVVRNAGGLYDEQQAVDRQDEQRKLGLVLAQKGIKLGEDGSWSLIPGAQQAQADMEGTGSPLVQSYLYKLRTGQPTSPEEQQAFSHSPLEVQRLGDTIDYRNAVDERFGKNFGFKVGERELPGYTNVTGATPPTATINNLREKITANQEVKNALEKLKATGDEGGFMQLVGSNAQAQAALQSSIFNAYRKRTGSGARLEGPEGDMIKAMTPQVLAGDALGAIKAASLGRNQKEFADFMIKFLDEDQDAALFSQGFKANNRPLNFYPKDQVEKFGLSGLAESGPQEVALPQGNQIQSGGETKNIGGRTYQKVAGGWKAVN